MVAIFKIMATADFFLVCIVRIYVDSGTDNINDTIHIYDAVLHLNGTEIGWTSKDELKEKHQNKSRYSVERQLTNTSITYVPTIYCTHVIQKTGLLHPAMFILYRNRSLG